MYRSHCFGRLEARSICWRIMRACTVLPLRTLFHNIDFVILRLSPASTGRQEHPVVSSRMHVARYIVILRIYNIRALLCASEISYLCNTLHCPAEDGFAACQAAMYNTGF